MKAFHKFCVLFVMAAICCLLSQAQSADSTIVILHVARVNYLEEQIFCRDTNLPVLKKINKTKGLTINNAMAMVNKDTGIAEDCQQAYLFELLLTMEIVQQIQSAFNVHTVPQSPEDVESEIKDSISHENKAPAAKRPTIHLLVSCQVTRKRNDGHSYLLILEVKPIMEGPIGSQSRPIDVEISNPKRPDLAKYYYEANQDLYKLCNETIKKLHSSL